MVSTFPILLLISFLISAIAPCLSDPRISQAALVCGNRTADSSHRQTFVENFLSVMDAVTPQIASRRFAWATAGTTRNDSVFAFGECLKDLSRRDCDLCFATCKTQILRCLPFQMATRGGRNYLDGCYLRCGIIFCIFLLLRSPFLLSGSPRVSVSGTRTTISPGKL